MIISHYLEILYRIFFRFTNLQEKRWFIILVESRIVDGIMAATIEEKTLNELT